jgi:sugar phosphate isomerase/epimerase
MRARNIHSRRRFILTSSAAFAASLARPAFAFASDSPYLETIGLQLYTVRNQLAEDEDATLKAVADAGYKQVELGSVSGDGPRLAAKARKLGMKVTSSFCDFNTFTTDGGEGVASVGALLREAVAMKLEHLVFGYVPKGSRETIAQYQRMAERCNAAAPRFRDAGIQLCYHNHSFEFAPLEGGEKTGFDYFMEMFEPAMKFELDVFWVKIGGVDPLAMLRKLDGRVSQVHLKDLKLGTATQWDEGQVPKDAFQELGDGEIDMSEVMRVSKEIGVVQCHVEQDQSPAPLDSIVQSINHLRVPTAVVN